MEANEFDKSGEACTPAQPQFDDEQTLLSARPVVPLETINARVKNRRYWLLAGALAIAMMLGAGSALLASYLKFRSVPEAATEIAQEEITPAPLAVAESVPSESPVTEENVEEPDAIPAEPKKEAKAKRRTSVRRTPDYDAPRNAATGDDEDELQRIREAVLYDQWQERRARRVRRERRKLERYNHRDLSNLDEIFEGRRKP